MRGRVVARNGANARNRVSVRGETRQTSGLWNAASAAYGKFLSLQPAHRVAACAVCAVFLAVLVFGISSALTRHQAGFPDSVEQWRPTVETACKDVGLDIKWVDTVLAMMRAESVGDTEVGSVVGASCDIMQAGEGCAGVYQGDKDVIDLGSDALAAWGITPNQAFDGGTPTASIYAGVLETKMNVDLFEGWLGPIDVSDAGKIALIAQGYNYGAQGWFDYCSKNGITSWTLEASQAYQNIVGGGTAGHGGKVADYYTAARAGC